MINNFYKKPPKNKKSRIHKFVDDSLEFGKHWNENAKSIQNWTKQFENNKMMNENECCMLHISYIIHIRQFLKEMLMPGLGPGLAWPGRGCSFYVQTIFHV